MEMFRCAQHDSAYYASPLSVIRKNYLYSLITKSKGIGGNVHMTHAEVTYQRSPSAPATGEITVADVRFEHLRDALGIGTARPRISWIIANAPDDWRQAGYEIESLAADAADGR